MARSWKDLQCQTSRYVQMYATTLHGATSYKTFLARKINEETPKYKYKILNKIYFSIQWVIFCQKTVSRLRFERWLPFCFLFSLCVVKELFVQAPQVHGRRSFRKLLVLILTIVTTISSKNRD